MGTFLRTWREAVTPAEAGLPTARRAPGRRPGDLRAVAMGETG